MSLTLEDVAKVSRLARLGLSTAEQEHMRGELNPIMKWIEKLQEIDTTGVEVFQDIQVQEMTERKDVVTDGDKLDQVLSNAPESAHGMFAVPKVVE
jgi:aspartyl-tRNA(Asn)/glutamyl-tRNA(Gln) amidotransferase subunit C